MISRKKIRNFVGQLFDLAVRHCEDDLRDGLRIIARAILEHRVLLTGLFIFNLLAAICEGGTMGILALAVSALIQQQTMDELISWSGDWGTNLVGFLPEVGPGGLFLILVLLAVFAQLMKSLMTYIAKKLSIRLQFRTSKELQRRSTDQIMDYSFSEVTKIPAGVLSGLIGETSRVSAIVGLVNRGTLAVVMFLGYVTAMFVLSVPLALSAIVIVAVIGFGVARITERLRELGKLIVDGQLMVSKLQVEFLQAPRLLRVFGATKFAGHIINITRDKSLDAQEQSANIKALVDPSIDALTIFAAGCFLVLGYLVSGEDSLTVIPKLLLFLLILNRMMPQAKALNETRMGFVNAVHGIGVVGAFLRTQDKMFERIQGDPFSGLTERIAFEGVSFRYPETNIEVLRDLTFSLQKGQTLAVVGGSGAGKSTIVSLCLGLYEPRKGVIRVDGKDLQSLSLMDWRNKIGVVDQEIFLLNGTIRENITFATDEYTFDEVINAARLAHAHEFIENLPEAYETIIGDRGFRLSGGQQQRIGMARALVRRPDILVLDEATSALDSESEQLIQRTIENLRNNMTILVIAHRLSTIAKADQIIVLDHGQISEYGKFEELTNSGGVFEKLWRLQLGDQ